MAASKYLDYAGLARVKQLNDELYQKAISGALQMLPAMPSTPTAGQLVWYIGETTASYIEGSIYRYSGTAWIEVIGSITNSEVDALFD